MREGERFGLYCGDYLKRLRLKRRDGAASVRLCAPPLNGPPSVSVGDRNPPTRNKHDKSIRSEMRERSGQCPGMWSPKDVGCQQYGGRPLSDDDLRDFENGY